MKKNTKKCLNVFAKGLFVFFTSIQGVNSQITLKQDYTHNDPADIGTFQGINFKEGGFSALYPILGTNGKEFWTISDRGVNIDAANANLVGCRPTYDKIYSFPNYVPKIHRIRIVGSSIKVLQTITMKRPDGSGASGIINPTGFGSTALEVASTDTVLDCNNFNLKTTAKDVWGIDSEGLVVDAEGNFWIAEEGGPTIWKLNKNGVVVKRYTPYANLVGAEPQDEAIDTVFKYRKNNRGFEGLSITPNGKIYAIIQSPVLYPSKAIGEGSRIHRILEINPLTDETRMFAYLNDGVIGTSGANQIRLRDWKIGDMAAINNDEFLVIEQALRGTTDRKFIYKINISNATNVNSGLYSGVTLEALVDQTGLTNNSITPVQKTLFMDLLANNWPSNLEKAEGLAIINDSTFALVNDNDFGQYSPAENGLAVSNGILSHLFTYGLSGSNKITNYVAPNFPNIYGEVAMSTLNTPYLQPSIADAKYTSILTAGDDVNGYKLAGLGDGLGAYDNNDGTFSLLMNHEMSGTEGITRAHGQKGAFVSKWIINKNDLTVVSGSDLIQTTKLWNGTSYATYNNSTPAPTAFSRFCAADLPIVSAFYNAKTGLGTQNRIFMNGEESGNEGRAFAHIATGTEAGTTYELPRLGKFSWENAIACPSSEDKTVVIGLDDATPGQVYVYVGTKTNTGNDVEKAGLTNGNLYGIAVNGLTMETSSSVPTANTTFALANIGNVENQDGFSIQINSVNAGVTAFLRPEDGAWDPSHPEDFYFATTNSFTSPSRLWKLHFTDVKNPELGGTITAVLDGTEGQKMLDNLTIDNSGHILLQEDPGNQSYVAKMYEYNTATDVLTTIAQHDESRFVTGGANFLTQDEESSGIIDVQEILGAGQFILYDQAHYAITGEVVQGGQLLAFYNPSSADSLTAIVQQPSAVTICEDANTTLSISAQHATHYQWQVLNGATYVDLVNNAMYSDVTTNTLSINNADLSLNGKVYRCIAGRLTGLKDTSATASISINQKTVPTFASVNAFCEGTLAPVLATTSNNSIDGLWQPATINNTSSATYTFTPNSNECAAEININVVVKPKTYSTTAQTICASELPYAWNGLVITSAGTYTKNLNGINTCDSIATLNLAVNTLDLTTSYSAGVLSANATNASYTWINCATNTPVSGQTSQTFSPTVNGNYAVIVNANNCSDTSACFNVSDLSVNDIHSALNNVSVYPNPTNNLVNVKIVSNENSTVAIELVDALGKLVQNTKNHDVMIGENLFEMNTQELNDGVYFISILSGNNSSKIKLIVKH